MSEEAARPVSEAHHLSRENLEALPASSPAKPAAASRAKSRRYASGTNLLRQDSALKERSSHDLLRAIAKEDIDDVRTLLESGLSHPFHALTHASSRKEYHFRTPLMTAAKTGDYGIFSTVLRALERCFTGTNAIGRDRQGEVVSQLKTRDMAGMTLAMIAARSGNVPILSSVLKLILDVEVLDSLVDMDYERTTVLMHACSSGTSATFVELFRTIEEKLPKKKVEDHLIATSGDNRTLLMHAAKCGDQMTLVALSSTFRRMLDPKEVRRLLKSTDYEGMTFLMHAASSSREWARRPGMRESSVEGSSYLRRSYDASEKGIDGVKQEAVVFVGSKDSVPPAGEDKVVKAVVDEGTLAEHSRVAVMIFKAAFDLVTEFLWKEQVREQLKAKDSWGRTVLTHAVISGHTKVFETAFYAMRGQIYDYEVEALFVADGGVDDEAAMETTITHASRDMRDLVTLRHQQLKRSMAVREKASSIQARIRWFIPGGFIVVFQLILPELDRESDEPLFLLVIMCALAPLVSFAGSLIAPEGPTNRGTGGRRSVISFLLTAPALFFWGLGTSTVAQQSFKWSDPSSSAAMAVATIVIPALDAFFGSQLIGDWYDKIVCKKYLFSKKARKSWMSQHDKMAAAAARQPPLTTVAPPLTPRGERYAMVYPVDQSERPSEAPPEAEAAQDQLEILDEEQKTPEV